MGDVHSSTTCGETFSDLAHDLTQFIQNKQIHKASEQLERCKEARLGVAARYNEMNDAHAAVYNLVDYLQDCIVHIHKTVKFAEVYGGTSTISYNDRPMRFTIELQIKEGKRVYTIKSRGYDFVDFAQR
jgi:hypothetical protein